MTKLSARGRDALRHPVTGQVVRGAEVTRWLDASHSSDPRTRTRAAQHLCPCHTRQNHRAVWDRVIEMTLDEDARVRAAAFHMLCDGSPREYEERIVAAIEALYQDPDPKLRRRVRKLLAHHRRTGQLNIL